MKTYFGINKTIAKNKEDESDEDESGEIYRENNHIYFYSEIDRKSIQSLVKLIREAEEYCYVTAYKLSVDVPIFLHISSLGGYIYYALIAVDAIQRCKIPIYSIVEGSVASAGTMISIVCKKRYICPNAFMMIHQLSSEVFGKMNEITDEYENLSELMDVLKKLYITHTEFSKKKIEKLLKHDIYLSSKKAMKYKLVDELYENELSPQRQK
jgi:ATP-dependent protease ClpP protease subunit